MNLENQKQYEYLNDIQNVGMNAVMHNMENDEVLKVFGKYAQYIEDDLQYRRNVAKLNEYCNTNNHVDPDIILRELGKYTLNIKYVEEKIDDEIDECITCPGYEECYCDDCSDCHDEYDPEDLELSDLIEEMKALRKENKQLKTAVKTLVDKI